MIQWFPGHMAKALKQIKEIATLVDLFIVVLDARAPLSSYNEEFDLIEPNKPRLFVIAKNDLADQQKLDHIVKNFQNDRDLVVVGNLHQVKMRVKILTAASKLLAKKRADDIAKGFIRPRLRAIVMGVPNSGKSTLINLLAIGAKTKTANRPGVTRGQQWVKTKEFELLDTPGILWPKFEDPLVGIKLAIIGSVRIEVIPIQELFFAGFNLLTQFYPKLLTKLGFEPTSKQKEIYSQLTKFCQERGFLKQGGGVHLTQGMNFFFSFLKKQKGVTYD